MSKIPLKQVTQISKQTFNGLATRWEAVFLTACALNDYRFPKFVKPVRGKRHIGLIRFPEETVVTLRGLSEDIKILAEKIEKARGRSKKHLFRKTR